MEVVYTHCCGLDVHKKTVVACRITPGADGKPVKAIRTFGTMTDDLLTLADWLAEAGVTHVAMESTGVYWQPIYNLLEDQFTLLLVNAQHIKAVPGRKTDVQDSEWVADLLRHGLLRGSVVPARRQREVRELTRYRTQLVQERVREVNRLQKTLEGANVKLGSVASDVVGKSGREILAALVAGTEEPTVLAALAKGRLREKRVALERALRGQFGAHQRFLVAQHLARIDELEGHIGALSAEVAARLRPFQAALERLDTIPGVNARIAEQIVAELGGDLSRFPTAQHLASWAGMCPGNDRSAARRGSGKTRKGNRVLRAVLVEAAHGAARSKDTYLAVQYHRLAAKRGKKRALVAVGHTILVIVYHLLTRGVAYQELGGGYYDERDRQAVQRRLTRRLERLGYKVTLEPAQAA